MNARILASTCAVLVGAYGIAPAAADSFNDRSGDWVTDSPVSAAASINNPQTFASSRDGRTTSSQEEGSSTSWNVWTPLLEKGKTAPSQYQGPSSSPASLATGQRCEAPPRVGFKQETAFPTC